MRWKIRDFKGVAEGEIDLSPGVLTVLAGANSSGKSSILQSILMTAQSGYQDGNVVLNGPLTRLGEAEDLVREGAHSVRIEVEFQSDEVAIWYGISDTPAIDGTETYRAGIELRPNSTEHNLTIHELTLARATDQTYTFRASKENARIADVDAVRRTLGPRSVDVLHVKSLLSDSQLPLRTYVAFEGLRPIGLFKFDHAKAIARRHASSALPILADRSPKAHAADDELSSTLAPGALAREVANLLGGLSRTAFSQLPTQLREVRGRPGSVIVRAFRDLDRDDLDRALQIFSEHRASWPFVYIGLRAEPYIRRQNPSLPPPGVLDSHLLRHFKHTADGLRAFRGELDQLASAVQYLGPLRDEPRVVWAQWNQEARGLPVGARGEFGAAVLSRASNRIISYVDPGGNARQGPLNVALDEWLRELEIGSGLSAHPRGKLGIGVELEVAGARRDLTAVGVGVSQAFPLMVAFLLVRDDSIFIVEQPELHLHPAVQAALADFMARARPNVSTIVETHSEAFLTRLRRRVAENVVDRSRIQVTFVETVNGTARTRDLRVSEYGDLSEWPNGFMSGALDDASAILRANVARASGRSSDG